MMQRYIVFLNDKVVTVGQGINKSESGPDEIAIDFTDKSALLRAYKRFYLDQNCLSFKINSGDNFPEACKAFNSLFKRIAAAGGIVRNPQGECLFIKRLGIWDLPKGKLHKKESPRVGALREVCEETGLSSLTITRELPSTYHIYPDRNGEEVLKETFWFEMICHEPQILVPQLEEDITEVKWFASAGLIIPMHNTYASLRHLLEGYFSL